MRLGGTIMGDKKVIPVFFSIDDGYAPLLGVALESMLENASREYEYKVTVLINELSSSNKEKLKSIVGSKANLQFTSMGNRLASVVDGKSNRLRMDYFTLTIYFRIFISAMFPEYDKAIYLDSDIVVVDDISKMYGVDLGDNLIGAVNDFSIRDVPELVHFVENGVGIPILEYFNSGILLMNLKAMRDVKLEEKFLYLFNTYHFGSVAPDQDYLNCMCNGRVTYLPYRWDVMPQKNKADEKDISIVHYNLFKKPWLYKGVQYEDYFWRYAKDSIYYPEIKEILDNYTEEDRKRDSFSMQNLISRAQEIPSEEITFKSIINSGKESRI